MKDNNKVVDESKRAKYGTPVEQYPVSWMKERISDGIDCETSLDYNHDENLSSDVILIEDEYPILDILVRNRKWDKGHIGLKTINDYCPTKRVEKHLSELKEIPTYLCFTSKRIEETIEFANLWSNRNYNELYKLYPNKIKEINKRRKQ